MPRAGGGQQQQQQLRPGSDGSRNDERLKENAEESQSKKRRNRRNRRQKDKAEQQGGCTAASETDDVSGGKPEECDNNQRKKSQERSESVVVPGTAKGGNNVYSGVRSTVVKHNGDCEWNDDVNYHVSDGGIRKKLKSFGEPDSWRNSGEFLDISEEYDARLSPVSSRPENCGPGHSWSSVSSHSDKYNSERMPVTMHPEHHTENSRRRGKAAAQIYRPPPARSTKEDVISLQQQQQQQLPQQQHQQYPYHQQQSHLQKQYPQHYNSYRQDYHRNQYQQENHYQQQTNHHPYQLHSNRQRTDSESSNITTVSDYQGKGRGRRPDKVLYVPRGRRNVPADTSSARATPTPMQEYEQLPRPPSPAYSISSVASEFSGRNRYNKQGSRQGSQISIYDGEVDTVKGKPPLSKGDFSRESTPGHGRHKGGGGRFNAQTLQLIERCLNQDSEAKHKEHSHWENDSINNSPSPKNNRLVGISGGRIQKSPTPTREIHSVHSKENVIHPVESSQRSRKSRRNRRRHSRSREPSADQYNDKSKNMGTKDFPCHTSNNRDQYNDGLGDRGFGSCERVFYNSNYNTIHERYDRGYDNYDRYSSINNSRTSSRNSSHERIPQQSPSHSWRGGSFPASPSKSTVMYYHTRNSPGKPPSGRLGSLPNVALDLGEGMRRVTNQVHEEPEKCHTLPAKHHKWLSGDGSRSNTVMNSNSEERRSCFTLSDKLVHSSYKETHQTVCDVMNQKVSDNRSQKQYDSCSKDNQKNGDMSCNSVLSTGLTNIVPRLEDTSKNVESNSQQSLTNVSLKNSHNSDQSVISSEYPEKDIKSDQNYFIMDGLQSDSQCDASDLTTSGVISEEEICDAGNEAPVTDSLEDLGKEIASSVSGVEECQSELKDGVVEEKEEKKNPKKFAFNWADEVEDSWDNLYDETGECLDPDIKRQLSDSIGKVKLEKPVCDYYAFEPKEPQMNEEEYAHVIEIYDFPVSFKTQDLMMVFNAFQNTGFDIKWVDDTHALGIFSTGLIASEALNVDHPFLKTRSLALATKSSKAKAMRITDALLPYKPRPATSASLARRLVSGALGLKVNISQEVREAEKQKLKDAKARKKLEAKQRVDAWEGTLT